MNARTLLAAAIVASLSSLALAQAPAPQPQQPRKPAAAAPAPAAKAAPKPAPAPAPAATPAPAAAPPPPTGPIGTVALVTGRVTATSAAAVRSLGAGDPLFEGQAITVGPNSYASLKFNDGGRVLLRPNTEFVVESFRSAAALAPAPAPAAAAALPATAPPPAVSGNAFFRLVRGGFRAVTGLIGKADRADYRVSTPAATIGIRGTDFEVVTCTDDCPAQASAAAGGTELAAATLEGLELAQAGGGGGSGGIVVATHEGTIVLRTSRGETVVDVGQVALALASGQTLMLPRIPDLILQNPVPAPAACE